MKKLLVIVLSLLLACSLIGCSDNGSNEEPSNKNNALAPIKVSVKENNGDKTYTFTRIPVSVDDLKSLDITDEYIAACAIIFALQEYELDPDKCYEMLDYMMGPEDINSYVTNFIKNQMDQYPYVVRSYFDGATVENDYDLSYVGSVSLTLRENIYSRDEDGYVKLYITSAGADSDRSVTLRKKASTGEWFLFSDTYMGLLAGIRQPASGDKWK